MTDTICAAVLEAAATKAREMGITVAIAVLNEMAALKGFLGMDGARLLVGSAIAQDKAYTALAMGAPTEALSAAAESPVGAAFLAKLPRILPAGGGVPLTVNGSVIGAIGVSGGTPEQDVEVANAGAAALSA